MKDDGIRDPLLGQRREESNGAVTYYFPRDAAYLEMKLRVLHFIWYRLITRVDIPDDLLDTHVRHITTKRCEQE